MNRAQFSALQSGDQIVYDGKPDVIWVVDHPATCSKKKEAFNVDDGVAVPCIAGGGECIADGFCIRASTIVLNGRGAPRHSQTFSDPTPWTKVVPPIPYQPEVVENPMSTMPVGDPMVQVENVTFVE